MAQDYIKINNKKVWQPDSDTAVAFETTYTQGKWWHVVNLLIYIIFLYFTESGEQQSFMSDRYRTLR